MRLVQLVMESSSIVLIHNSAIPRQPVNAGHINHPIPLQRTCRMTLESAVAVAVAEGWAVGGGGGGDGAVTMAVARR